MRWPVASAWLAGACVAAAWPSVGASGERIADIRQGTNLTLTLAPDARSLVVELAGQLWQLPASGGGATPLTPADQDVRNPRYAPDGKRIVYQKYSAGQWDLWLLDLASGSATELTATPYDERQPDFSPDGRSVVFASDRTGHYCLWSLDLSSKVWTQLTEEPGNAAFPSVSDLGQIAYVLEGDGRWSLRVLAAAASTEIETSSNRLSNPSWRPGGGVLVFSEQGATGASHLEMAVLSDPPVFKPLSGDEDIFRARPVWPTKAEFIYAADGQLWRRGLTAAPRRPVHLFAALAVEDHEPPTDLKPLDTPGARVPLGINGVTGAGDGRRTAFTALGDLWLSERNELHRLTDDAFVEIDPAFAPDGRSIVFASDRDGTLQLWRLELKDRHFFRLTAGTAKPYRPVFSPDGKRLAFLETDGFGPWGPARLRVLNLDGGAEATTAASGLIDPGAPAWDSDGRLLRLAARAKRADASQAELPGIEVEISADASPPAGGSAPRAPAFAPPRALQWQPAPGTPEEYVVQVGRLFDGASGTYRRHVDIHVAGSRIRAIVGRDVLPLPATVIDVRDATVIPGLIDVHAHESALSGERLGRAWLAYGVTTVREISSDVAASLEIGEAWASGRRPGPRLVITPSADADPPTAAMLASEAVPVRRYPGLADGLAHSLSRQSRELDFPTLERPENEAKTPGSGSRHYELEVSPMSVSYQDAFSRLIESSTVMTPELAALAGWGGSPDLLGRRPGGTAPFERLFSPAERSLFEAAAPDTTAVPALEQTVARLVRAGGHVAVGSDAPSVPYGAGVHRELALLAAAGIPNDQVLRLATAEGALALGLERQIGTVEAGKLADFVVLDGDPLERITDTLKITAVVKNGVWIDRGRLLGPP
jgi:Tol biopolymer transport system component